MQFSVMYVKNMGANNVLICNVGTHRDTAMWVLWLRLLKRLGKGLAP